MATFTLPDAADLADLIAALIPEIGDEYRACDDDAEPSMLLTIGCDGESTDYGWQTGDNSFTGGAYGFPYWGSVAIYRDSDPAALAEELLASVAEALPY